MVPSVKFDTDIELDIQMTLSFLAWGNKDGLDFSDSIFGPNPGLREVDMEDEPAVEKFFKKAYAEKKEDLQKVLEWNRENWGKMEKEYVTRVIKLFKGHEFPEGKYIGYLSINNCNPRFLEDKTFQMYYKAKVYTRTISHELLHFIFYDYTAKVHSKVFGHLDPNEGVYWSLAELFNNVILSLPEFVELLNNFEDDPYPDHERHFVPLQQLWQKTQDVDKFILEGFEYLSADAESKST
ncbi:MAG: hypothetical protein JNK26_05115 [Candidatus Doudnabacteria bacterium]|nr:hypothetical protein [Candidatus Doudnabacteria bacterium]